MIAAIGSAVSTRVMLAALVWTALLWPGASALAHEVRPAYLELREVSPAEFTVLWKTPLRGDARLALEPEFSGRTELLQPVVTRRGGGAAVQTWRIRAVDPLRGTSLRIAGLDTTMTDALIRVEFGDGTQWVHRAVPQQPAATIPQRQGPWAVAAQYLALGVEHILFGIDHLLFVLSLMLLLEAGAARTPPALRPDARSQRRTQVASLLRTITAFTVAHSVTLALATLGVVAVPSAPVEATIALSIVFVCAEIVRAHRFAGSAGSAGDDAGLALRAPWMVAFAFGLLHGFGFAGALAEIGLPQGQIPLALLFFNCGVEAGQLLFVAAVLACAALWKRVVSTSAEPLRHAAAYTIGSLAMYWVILRASAL